MDCFIFDGMQYMLHGGNGGMGVGTCRVLRFYWALCETYALRGRILCFTVFSDALRNRRPSGTPSFAARRKIEEKDTPKGSKAALWNLAFYTGVWRGDVPRFYEFALVQFTRFRPVRGVLRTASTDSIVLLQLRRNRNTYRITDVSQTRQSGGFGNLQSFYRHCEEH